MKAKKIGSAVLHVIMGSLALGVVVASLNAVGASMEAEVKNKSNSLTAQLIVDRIKQNVTCPWQKRTVDTFKAGDPDAQVTGVAVTFMATYDVLRRAAQQKCNLVITHEPTFYHGQDDTSQLDPDPIIDAKREFIRDNHLIVWRFHDHIHRTEPDGIVTGMINMLGWKDFQKQEEKLHFEFPKPMSLQQFVTGLKEKYAHSAIRIIGDPQMQFTRFGLAVGAPGSIKQMKMLQTDDIEVLVAGEAREWETVEYVRDAKDMGRKKAVILLGHCISEEAGMKYCGEWLKSFVSEVPIKFIPAGDPFWTPSAR